MPFHFDESEQDTRGGRGKTTRRKGTKTNRGPYGLWLAQCKEEDAPRLAAEKAARLEQERLAKIERERVTDECLALEPFIRYGVYETHTRATNVAGYALRGDVFTMTVRTGLYEAEAEAIGMVELALRYKEQGKWPRDGSTYEVRAVLCKWRVHAVTKKGERHISIKPVDEQN
jgi:hypothetical protein